MLAHIVAFVMRLLSVFLVLCLLLIVFTIVERVVGASEQKAN